MPTFNADKIIAEFQQESKATELNLSIYTLPDEKAMLCTEPLATLTGHSGWIYALAALPDGRFISGSADKTIKLWDGQGKCLATLTEHSYIVLALAVLPDGRFVSSAQDNTIKLWDGKGQCLATLTEHNNGVSALVVLPDGRFISGCWDKTIKLWNGEGQCLATLMAAHSSYIRALALLPDGRFISGSDDFIIKLWDGKLAPRVLCWTDIAPVLAVLASQHQIQKLNLQKLKLDDNDVPALLKALQSAKTLRQIDIRETLISAGGAKTLHQGLIDKDILHPAMAEILQAELKATYADPLQKHILALQAEKIVELDFSQEKIFDETAQDFLRPLVLRDLVAFFEALQSNRSLKKLSLQACMLSDEAIMTLAAVLNTNTTLIELNLTNTDITKQGIKELQQELKARKGFLKLRHESSLVTLILGGAPIEEKTPEVKQEASPAKKPKDIDIPAEEKIEKKIDKSPAIAVSYVIKFDELELGKKLGQGGFGIVYQANWRFDEVAVKQLLSDQLSDDTLKEFKTEAQTMARLRYRNVVQFYGYCESPKYCLVMEYMPKGSLYNVLHSQENLSWEMRIKIITDIACGLAFLHKETILHRDIKSLNVLLNNHMEAKLTDFGLSKVKHETSTSSSKNVVGTVAWMAPELFDDEPHHTKKADIYSMGITFWEIASRELPFKNIRPAVIPNKVISGKRDDIPSDCPKKLASLIKFCWQSDPNKRPEAANIVKYLKSQSEDFATFDPQASNSNAMPTSSQTSSSSTPYYRSNLVSESAAPSLRK